MFKRTVGQLLHTPKMTDSDHQLARLGKSMIHFACISSTNIERLLNSVCQLIGKPAWCTRLLSPVAEDSESLQLASFTKDRTSLPVLLFDLLAKQVNQHPMPRIVFAYKEVLCSHKDTMWPPLATRQSYPHTTFSTADITPDLDICVTIDTTKNKSVDKLASFSSLGQESLVLLLFVGVVVFLHTRECVILLLAYGMRSGVCT